MDFLKKNTPLIIASIIAAGMLFYAYGCEPKTRSLLDPNRKINRQDLTFEMQTLLNRSEVGFADLDHQIEIRNLIFQQGLLIAQGGSINPLGVITSVMAVLGIGAAADDIRLRKKIKNAA